jgi:hypothetical protein
MSFADRAKIEPKPDAVSRLTSFIDSLPDSEREHALLLLKDAGRFPLEYVAKQFREEGYPLSERTVKAWRLANV